MTITVIDPIKETLLFAIPAGIILASSVATKHDKELFSPRVTNNLKGFAIIAIVLSHIGYYLDNNDKFLFPFSVFAGVGVNLFLILSGFGLTRSMIHKHLKPGAFYLKRFPRILIPLWLSSVIFLIMYAVLKNQYFSIDKIGQIFIGYFPSADIYIDFNSPLWYITPTIFYYIIFPIVFFRKAPVLSAAAILLISLYLVKLNLPVSESVLKLYKLHVLAFPAGMILAILFDKVQFLASKSIKIKKWVLKHMSQITLLRLSVLILLTVMMWYFAINSEVGNRIAAESFVSLSIVAIIVGIALISPLRVKILEKYGKVSYEIYLIHWPIMLSFDLFYQYLSPALATILYFILFYFIARLIQQISTSAQNVFYSSIKRLAIFKQK